MENHTLQLLKLATLVKSGRAYRSTSIMSVKKNYKFSIIIPTRNRQRTAIYAVKSALNVRYSNVEIVVVDNSDTNELETRLISDGLYDRVVYYKTDSVLSMRDNWERGIELASGDLLTIMGDDDAIMPDACEVANYVFNSIAIDLLHGYRASYKWDDYPFIGRRKQLSFSIGDDLRVIENPHQILRQAYNYDRLVGTGPGIYYGFLRREFLESIKKMRGRYIVDQIPDFDLGYSVLIHANRYAVSTRIMFIEGMCGASNSGAMRYNSNYAANLQKLVNEAKSDIDTLITINLREINSTASSIVACQLRRLPEIQKLPDLKNLELNYEEAWKYLLDSVKGFYDKIAYFSAIPALERLIELWALPQSLKRELKNDWDLPRGLFVEQGFRKKELSKMQESKLRSLKISTGYESCTVNGQTCNLNNILDAVDFMQAVMPTTLVNTSLTSCEAWEVVNAQNSSLLDEAESLFVKENEDDRVVDLLNQVLAISPDNERAFFLYEKFLNRKNNQPALIRLYEERFSRTANKDDLFQLLTLYEKSGFTSLGTSLLKGLLTHNEISTQDKVDEASN